MTGGVEEWRAVRGYEGSYEVSSIGNVRSLPRLDRLGRRTQGKDLKHLRGTPRPYVQLSHGGGKKDRRNIEIQRLVAIAFVPGEEDGLEVCHIDGNKFNNVATNLRWDTHSNNMIDTVDSHFTCVNAAKTHCPHGHEYSPENTITFRNWNGRPARRCRECSNAYQRRRYAARKPAHA